MRIAYVAVKSMPVGGGIEKLTEEIGSRLADRGHRVIVYSGCDYGTVNGLFKGMEIKTVPSINTKSLHKLSICFNSIRDILQKQNAGLVHVHAVGPSVFSIFPRMKGIPTVVQTHGLEWKRDKWGFFAKAFVTIAKNAVGNRLFVCVWEDVSNRAPNFWLCIHNPSCKYNIFCLVAIAT